MNQPRYESSRAGEWVEDVNFFIRQRAIEIFLQNVINRLQNKIDDFNRRVNNAETFDSQRQCGFEKFVIKFNDDSLALFGGCSDFATFADGIVKFIKLRVVIFGVKQVENFFALTLKRRCC